MNSFMVIWINQSIFEHLAEIEFVLFVIVGTIFNILINAFIDNREKRVNKDIINGLRRV